ncbi:MAG: hypothetical protein AB7I25_03330 [Vicinamibacterales bacterium]
MTTGEYCRAVEAYLCRVNGGHLVRIVGPSFDRVCGWEATGIPLRIVCAGIDRAVERRRAKGARRPLPIDFCEADILDVFEEWRRAVGVSGLTGGVAEAASEPAEARRAPSVGGHLDRVIARLTGRRGGTAGPLDSHLDALVRELDAMRSQARGVRGDARAALVARLAGLDRALLDAAWAQVDDASRAAMGEDADRELAPFRDRMTPEAWQRARDACVARILRDRARLPVVAFDV